MTRTPDKEHIVITLHEAMKRTHEKPQFIKKHGEKWITSKAVVEELRSLVSERNLQHKTIDWISSCRKVAGRSYQWDHLWILVSTAHRLLMSPNQFSSETISDWWILRRKLEENLPEFLNDGPQFLELAVDCFHYWQHVIADKRVSEAIPRYPTHSAVEVPVCIATENKNNDAGRLAWLKLEVTAIRTDKQSPPLAGALGAGRHPEDFQGPGIDSDFDESMNAAFKAAMHLVDNENSSKKFAYRGWWRLNAADFAFVHGRSASGAAALGWYHVLKKTKPDRGILVLAEINKDKPEEGLLEKVDGIAAKVSAIVKNATPDPLEPIDTIVVASEQNKKEALDELDNHDLPYPPRVGLPDELLKKQREHLVTVGSHDSY